MYLLVTNTQYSALQAINLAQKIHYRQIQPTKSSTDLWIVKDDLLTDCKNVGDTWYSWKTWLLSLEVSPDQTLKPRPVRPVPVRPQPSPPTP